jgi:hypothetical protein
MESEKWIHIEMDITTKTWKKVLRFYMRDYTFEAKATRSILCWVVKQKKLVHCTFSLCSSICIWSDTQPTKILLERIIRRIYTN